MGISAAVAEEETSHGLAGRTAWAGCSAVGALPLSHRIINVGKTSKTSEFNLQTIPTVPTGHVPQCHVDALLEYCWGW